MDLTFRLMALFASDLDTGPAVLPDAPAFGEDGGLGSDAGNAGFAAVMAALMAMPDDQRKAALSGWTAITDGEAGPGNHTLPRLAAVMGIPVDQRPAGLSVDMEAPTGQRPAGLPVGKLVATEMPKGQSLDASRAGNDPPTLSVLEKTLVAAQPAAKGAPPQAAIAGTAFENGKPLPDGGRLGAPPALFTEGPTDNADKGMPRDGRWFKAPLEDPAAKAVPKEMADGRSGKGSAAGALPVDARTPEQRVNGNSNGNEKAMEGFIQRLRTEGGEPLRPAAEESRIASDREQGVMKGVLHHRGGGASADGAPVAAPASGGAGAVPAAITGDSLAPPDTRDAALDVKTSAKADSSPEAPSGAKDMQTDILRQIVQRMTLHTDGRLSSMQINLKPEFLGHLRLQVMTENQQVTIRMVAANAAVKQMIEQNAHVLKAELQQHGLQVHKLEVAVSQDNHDPWQNGQHAAQFGHSQQRSRQEGRRPEGRPATFEKAAAAEETGPAGSVAAGGTRAVDYFA